MMANTDTYPGRVRFARLSFLHGLDRGRDFDNCFENWDGDAVVTALVREARTTPLLWNAIARDWGGEFPARWLATADRLEGEADLGKLSARLRAMARRETNAYMTGQQAMAL